MSKELSAAVNAYKKQMELHEIPIAYKGLMSFMLQLRTHFINKHGNGNIIGSFYQGYMDISYFPVTPITLKKKQLKIGIVFNHQKVQFELWLVGTNKKSQKNFWTALKQRNHLNYSLSKSPQDSIINFVMVANPNFSNVDNLIKQIEKETLAFIKNMIDKLGEK